MSLFHFQFVLLLLIGFGLVNSEYKSRYGVVEPSRYGLAHLRQNGARKYRYANPSINYFDYFGDGGSSNEAKILFDQKRFASKLQSFDDQYKKPTKYSKHTSGSKLKSSFNAAAYGKKCCGNEWLVFLDKTIRDSYDHNEPVHYLSHHQDLLHRLPTTDLTTGQVYTHEEDIKPVVEHIEDDLKYDFRTNTHSF